MKKAIFLSVILFQVLLGKAQIDVPIDAFTKVNVLGKLEVRLVQGDKEHLKIESTSVDVNQVDYAVKEGELKIKLVKNFPKEANIYVTIHYKHLEGVVANGFAKIYNRGVINSPVLELAAKSGGDIDFDVQTDSASVKANKGGTIILRGEAKKVNLNTSTGGAYRARTLETKWCVCTMNGGTAELKVDDYLEGNVYMGASLRYVKQPKTLVENTKFKGKIEPMEEILEE